MTRAFPIFAICLAACAGPATEAPDAAEADSSRGDLGGVEIDAGNDLGAQADASDDAGTPRDDVGTTDLGPEGCAALGAADCMADERCTLTDACADATGNEEPFDYLQYGDWEGIAVSEGDKSFPNGETAAHLTLFRSSGRDIRGVLYLPDHGVRHTVWGGVGPTGALGVYFSPPACDDATVCGAPFAAAYAAGGLATDLTLDFDDVTSIEPTIDFRTFVSLRLAPSDGFKPVAPVETRTDPVASHWKGDMYAVDDSGKRLDFFCEFTIDSSRLPRTFTSFGCADPNRTDEEVNVLASADAGSIAWADGVGWFATGPEDDDLLFVGRVTAQGPWEGVVTTRAGVWTDGDPIDPADVPLETVRGTFQFWSFQIQ